MLARRSRSWRQDLRVRTVLDLNLAGGVHDSDTHVDFSLSWMSGEVVNL